MPYQGFKILDVTWTELKAFKTRDSFALYYVSVGSVYEAIGITTGFIFRSCLTDSTEVTDFVTNFLSGAVSVSCIDDALGVENKLDVLKAVFVDSSFNSVVVPNNTALGGSQGGIVIAGFDGTDARFIKTDGTGIVQVAFATSQNVNIHDAAGTSLTSTANSLDVNFKSQTNAIKISKSTADNAVNNPIFVELSDGTAAFGTSGNPFFSTLTGTNSVRIQDSSGNSLNSTSGDLNVSLRDSAGTAITLSGGNLKSSLFDSSGNAAILTDNQVSPGSYGVVVVGGNDGSNIRDIAVDSSGRLKVDLFDNAGSALNSTSNALNTSLRDGSGNTVSSTSNALDINVKSQTNAIKVSKSTADNAAANPIFVELSDGAAAFGTSGNPLFFTLTGTNSVRIQDSSGNTLNSTSGSLNVSLRDSAGTAITLSGGNLKSSLFDASGNAAILPDNSASPGSYGVVVVGGNDGSNIRDIAVDSTGHQQNVTVQDLNRDGSRIETVFGARKVAQEETLLSASFAGQIISDDIDRYVEGGGAFSYINGKLRLDASTVISRVRIKGEQRNSYVAGAGAHCTISIVLGDTGSAGCTRRWGLMDAAGNNGYFFQLSGTTLQISRRSNGSDNTTNASSWSIVNTITPDTNGHIWEVVYQWFGVGRIIFRRDGIDVHTIEFAGTSTELSNQNPNLMPWIEVQNTTSQGASRYIEVGALSLAYESVGARASAIKKFHASTSSIPSTVTSGTEHGVISLNFRSTKNSVTNMSVARIRRIAISTSGSSTSNVDIRLKKNVLYGASTTFTADQAPSNPSTDWGATVPTPTVTANNATGTGYALNTTLAYEITALGAIGETQASTTSGTVNSGTPAKQISLSWPSLTYAKAYNIYRQTGGAGTYVYIGTSDTNSFTDNAITATAAVPPGSNTAEGESFMSVAEDLAPGNPGFTSNTGKTISCIRMSATGSWQEIYYSNELVLQPGENLMISATPGTNGLFTTAIVEWEEGVPTA